MAIFQSFLVILLQLHKYLSQNWDSDSHFEVLNANGVVVNRQENIQLLSEGASDLPQCVSLILSGSLNVGGQLPNPISISAVWADCAPTLLLAHPALGGFLQPNYFLKQCSSSSFFLTQSLRCRSKWPLSTEEASPMSKMFRTTWPFCTGEHSYMTSDVWVGR